VIGSQVTVTSERMGGTRTRAVVLVAALALPLVGLALLLAIPELDVVWEHHPSHFWLVLSVAFVNTVLGIAMSEAATRRDDVRLFLVSLALLASAGFLALHALATPAVLVHDPNNGFVIATPIGLFLAAGFAAASAMQPERGPGTLSRSARHGIRWGLIALLVAWAAASLSGVSFLHGPAPSEAPTPLRVVAPLAIGLYAFAAARYLAVYLRRRRPLPLAMATAFVLLAEAVLAIIVARSWHATWWEWHALMAVAFLVILLTARAEYEHEGSITAAFGGLYMERTLERIDQRQADSLTAMVASIRSDEPLAPVMERLLAEGMSAEEVASLERSARELVRVDTLFRPYVGPRLAARLHEEPSFGELGGKETDVTVLFADLAGFTAFSEGKRASEVIEMLNRYWEGTVPVVVDREGGLIERFAGDAVMAVFNALDDQPDHALRGARAALAMQAYTRRTAAEHPTWPRFRIGLNSGTAVIGTVGATGQRSFAAIGDTTNVAARVQGLADPGQVLLAEATYERIRDRVRVEARGSAALKGRAMTVDVFELREVLA
jgi:adenylate cyclase